MDDEKRGLQPISRFIQDALRQCGLGERLEERTVLLKWREIAGENVAAHVRAIDLREGVLVLEADHGAWRQELTMLAPQIITKFNALCGEGTVTRMEWRDRPVRGRKRGRGR